jgi:hypothetical protein
MTMLEVSVTAAVLSRTFNLPIHRALSPQRWFKLTQRTQAGFAGGRGSQFLHTRRTINHESGCLVAGIFPVSGVKTSTPVSENTIHCRAGGSLRQLLEPIPAERTSRSARR